MSATMSVQELVYEQTIQNTGVTDFGIDMQSALSGAQPIPPEGIRIDVAFEGEITGKITGKVAGTDYVLLRADGIGKLHVHVVITTDDGERIAGHADGIATMQPGSPTIQLRENWTLHTAAEKYTWVNRLHLWATGASDMSTGRSKLTIYSA